MDTHQPRIRRDQRVRNGEFKTGVKPWTQKRVDEHKQLDCYSFLLWLQDGIKPEDTDWFLEWAPTTRIETGDFKVIIDFKRPLEIKHFKTKRTMVDVLKFGSFVKSTHREMLAYVAMRQKADITK